MFFNISIVSAILVEVSLFALEKGWSSLNSASKRG